MKASRTVIAEAKFTNIRRQPGKADFGTKDYLNLPRMVDLKNYLAEITKDFMEQRRKKLGREYKISSISRVHEAYAKHPRYIFLIKVKAISTTLKNSQVIGHSTLKPLLKPSRWYELRFLMYIDLELYIGNKTVTNLKKDLQNATCYYDCNCMSFHYHGIRYRAKHWAMYPTSIPDPVQRVRFGMQSKVCKHIGAFSTDLMGFASSIKYEIDKLLD